MKHINRKGYIRGLEKLLLDDSMEICHEAILTEEVLRNILELLREEPERKKGKWIDYAEDGYVECPFCHSATNCDGNKDELHYCYSCGAKLR